MNKLQVIIIALAAALAGLLLGWFIDRSPDGSDQQESAQTEREVLYWVAPMDPNFRRDEPGKSPMGMDLVPVYADEAGGSGASNEPSIRINPAVINNIGVKTRPVRKQDLNREIEAVGVVTPDDGRISHVHVRTEGWIEELNIDTVGDQVSAGQPLFEIYSPALVSAQEEYLQATRTGNESLLRAARIRLVALGMSDERVNELRQRGTSKRLFAVRAPRDGYVIELNVRQGMYVQPGNTIISIADLSRVWVEVNLFEGQIAWVDSGQAATMHLPFAASDRQWRGEVDYVYPTMDAETRTGRVRLVFDNQDLALKPNMYARVMIAAAPHRQALAVPTQSIIRTGDGARVILALGEGRFRPARVETGLEVDGMTEILAGLEEGERIVVSSQFLIDSEASVDASLLRMIGEDKRDTESMDHETMDHETMDHEAMDHEAMDHEAVDHEAADQEPMDHVGQNEANGEKDGSEDSGDHEHDDHNGVPS